MQFFLIGGGDWRTGQTRSLDRTLLALVPHDAPHVLYVPTAGGDRVEDVRRFRELYEGLGATVSAMMVLRGETSLESQRRQIRRADVIYVGGGHTYRMMRAWKRHGFASTLKSAVRPHQVLAGLSAGAICWCESGMSGSYAPRRWMRVRGLNLLPFTLAVHANVQKRREAIPNFALRHRRKVLAIDTLAALEINNGADKAHSAKRGRGVRIFLPQKGHIATRSFATPDRELL